MKAIIKKLPALLLALTLLLAGCGSGSGTKPPGAAPADMQEGDAARLLSSLVQYHRIFDLGFGEKEANLEIAFYVDGQPTGSTAVGPIDPKSAGKYAFAVMEHQISGQAVYKAAIAAMDGGATYMQTFSVPEGPNLRGARYAIAASYDEKTLAPSVRTPLYGVFYTPGTEFKTDTTIEEALPASGAAIVFYLTIQ